jgi:hypothetical protein
MNSIPEVAILPCSRDLTMVACQIITINLPLRIICINKCSHHMEEDREKLLPLIIIAPWADRAE